MKSEIGKLIFEVSNDNFSINNPLIEAERSAVFICKSMVRLERAENFIA